MSPATTAGSEAELVEALRCGDERAFEELVRRHNSTLLRVARHYVSCDASAEEVVQDTWLGVLKGIERFRGGSSLKTWIFRILVNRAMTRGAREHRSLPFSVLDRSDGDGERAFDVDAFAPDGAWAVAPRPFDLPESRADLLELRERLREALEELPERQRVVVALRDVDGLSAEEVCDLLALTPNNQRVLLHRGRARLAEALAGYCRDV